MKWFIACGLLTLFALFMYFTGKAIDREAGQLNQVEERIRVRRIIDNRIREVVFTPTQVQDELYRRWKNEINRCR